MAIDASVLNALASVGTPSFVLDPIRALAAEDDRIVRERFAEDRTREERARARQAAAAAILHGLEHARKDVESERLKAERELETELRKRSPVPSKGETDSTIDYAARLQKRVLEEVLGVQALISAQLQIGLIERSTDPAAIARTVADALAGGRHVDAARLLAEHGRLRLDALARAEFSSNTTDRTAAIALQELTSTVDAWTRQQALTSPTVQRDQIRKRADARESDILTAVTRAVRAAGLADDVVRLEPALRQRLRNLEADEVRAGEVGQAVDAAAGMVPAR
jgi:hypothetical protein